MFSGTHVVIDSSDTSADRAFFRDILGFPHVDAGNGRLFFAMPSAEAGFHDEDHSTAHRMYLMCDDIEETCAQLRDKGVEVGPVADMGWGLMSEMKLPGGGTLAFYQPRHARPQA